MSPALRQMPGKRGWVGIVHDESVRKAASDEGAGRAIRPRKLGRCCCVDISQTAALLHGQERESWADAGYVGVRWREDMQKALATDEQAVKWHVAKRRRTL